MNDEASVFKALSDPIRLRLIILLAISGETCVCDLAEALCEPNYKVSRHLGILRTSGLVEARREGAWMHYRLAEGRTEIENSLQEYFRGCLKNHVSVRKDLDRLKKRVCAKGEERCG